MESRPIKIVFLLQDLEFGGTQRYALHLLEYLDRKKFLPELWVLRGGSEMTPIARKCGVKIVWMSKSSRVGPYSLLRLAFFLIRLRPTVLYTLTVVPNIWGRLFGKAAGIPVIISGYRSLLPKQHERFLWRFCDHLICNAEVLKEIMVTRFFVPSDRISVIPNGVDKDYFSPAPEKRSPEPTVLFVGRLVPEKNPVSLIKAFSKIVRKIPNARLIIIGNGALKEKLRSAIELLGIEQRVELLPGTADLRPYMRKAWVFALSSTQEAFPNAVIEAMASGLPVVATRVGGLPELIEDGKNGILVSPRNPEELSKGLIKILENPALHWEMGMSARERVVANYRLDQMLTKTEKALMDTVDNALAYKGNIS